MASGEDQTLHSVTVHRIPFIRLHVFGEVCENAADRECYDAFLEASVLCVSGIDGELLVDVGGYGDVAVIVIERDTGALLRYPDLVRVGGVDCSHQAFSRPCNPEKGCEIVLIEHLHPEIARFVGTLEYFHLHFGILVVRSVEGTDDVVTPAPDSQTFPFCTEHTEAQSGLFLSVYGYVGRVLNFHGAVVGLADFSPVESDGDGGLVFAVFENNRLYGKDASIID